MGRPIAFVLASFLISSTAAFAQGLPEIPPSLANSAGVVCLKVSRDGRVTGASIATSTGSAAKDKDLLEWAKRLMMPADSERRDVWTPMPVAFGDAHLPPLPKSCGPDSPAPTPNP